MYRTADYRRHVRERVIRKRWRIVTRVWAGNLAESPWWIKHKGKLSKWNLKCTCGMCKRERYSRAAVKVLDLRAERTTVCR